jgi:hypothetical protein
MADTSRLGPKELEKYHRISRNKGKQEAEAYLNNIDTARANRPTAGGMSGTTAPTGNRPAPAPSDVTFKKPAQATKQLMEIEQQNAQTATMQSTPNINNPFASREVAYDPNTGQATVNEKMSAEEQQRYNQSLGISNASNQLYNNYANQAMATGQFNAQPSINAGNFNTNANLNLGQFNTNPNLNLGQFNTQNSLNPEQWRSNNLPNQSAQEGYNKYFDETFNKTLDTFNRQAEKGIGRQREMLEQQMANEGIPRGSEKYNRAMEDFEKNANDARLNATNQAYLSGSQVADNAYKSALSGNQFEVGRMESEFGKDINKANFGLNANAQNASNTFNQFSGNMSARNQNASNALNQFNTNMNATNSNLANQINAGNFNLANEEARYFNPLKGLQSVPNVGQFMQPNLGAISGINAQMSNSAGLGMTGLNSLLSDKLGREKLNLDKYQADLSAKIQRLTARGGSLSLAEQKDLLAYRQELDRVSKADDAVMGYSE